MAYFEGMSDVNALVVEPLTKFFKDSAYLIKKCTKPDRKGMEVWCVDVMILYLPKKKNCSLLFYYPFLTESVQ